MPPYDGGVSETTSDRQPRPLSELLLAGVGWASLGAEAANELADDLAQRLGMDRDEMRGAMRDAVRGLRDEAGKVGLRGDETVERVVHRAGLVRREELDELALRLAQVEHRLALLERDADGV